MSFDSVEREGPSSSTDDEGTRNVIRRILASFRSILRSERDFFNRSHLRIVASRNVRLPASHPEFEHQQIP